MARTRPKVDPHSTMSPRLSVPCCTSTRRHHALVGGHVRFEAGAGGGAVRVGLAAPPRVQFGLEQDRASSRSSMPWPVTALVSTNCVSPPMSSGQQVQVVQLPPRAVDVRVRHVDLVDGDDDADVGGPGVGDGFFRLRHDAVGRGDDDHGDVGDVGPAGPHLGERLVARACRGT